MKIAYIATSEIPSQKANSLQVLKVCQALTQAGEQVHLYVPGTGKVDIPALNQAYGIEIRFPITRLPSRKALRRFDFTWQSLRSARRAGVDLVYTRMLWVARLAQFMDLPVILEMHDLPTGKFGPGLYKHFLRSKEHKLVVYITHALKRLADEHSGCPADPAEAVIAPDGVDLERYAYLPSPKEARARLNLPEMITAAYSGSFYAGRGLEGLMELAVRFPQVQFLWIGGDEPSVTGWQRKLSAAGVKNVRLTGFIPNSQLPLYQAAADILLIPYSRRVAGSGGGDISAVSSPLKMFEYLAAGRAILTSDLPVLREVLNDSNALFYPPEDMQAMAAAFASLVNDEGLRLRLAAQACADAGKYEWKARMTRVMQAYRGSLTR